MKKSPYDIAEEIVGGFVMFPSDKEGFIMEIAHAIEVERKEYQSLWNRLQVALSHWEISIPLVFDDPNDEEAIEERELFESIKRG